MSIKRNKHPIQSMDSLVCNVSLSHEVVLKPRLLIRPHPMENQCRQDYLMRIAEANRISGIKPLCKALNAGYQTLALLKLPDLVKYFCGHPIPEQFEKDGKRKKGFELDRLGLGKTSRICPLCLLEKLPTPDEFNFALTICCPIHRIVLTDTCPACGHILSYLRNKLMLCNCGCDLRDTPLKPAPAWVSEFYNIFAPWKNLQTDSSINNIFHYVEFKTLAFLRSLNSDFDFRQRSIKHSRALSQDFSLIKSIVENWPQELKKKYVPLSFRGKQRVQISFHKVKAYLPRLNAALSNILKWGNKRGYLNIPSTLPPLCKMTTMASLSRLIKIDYRFLLRLFESGYFKSAKATHNNGDSLRMISNEEAQIFSALISSSLNISEAAEVLGCKIVDIHAFIKLGFLTPLNFSLVSKNHAWFKRKDLDYIHDAFIANAKRIPDSDFAIKPVCDLSPVKYELGVFKKWKYLIHGIMEGSVEVYLMSGRAGLGALSIRESDLDRCYPRKRRRAPVRTAISSD